MNVAVADELDGRLFTDLSTLESCCTATRPLYIRTRASHFLPPCSEWKIRVRSGQRVSHLTAKAVAEEAKNLGPQLLECAGNTRSAHFGMVGVAEWSGVLLADVLDRFQVKGSVLISGFDRYEQQSLTSVPGATWVFRECDLRSSGAFLATEMNSAPLTPDHGAPIRLIVPQWYGCCCIKWVTGIVSVKSSAKASSQMIEYAARTGQHGIPDLASDYRPARIELGAMPIRVEKWQSKGRIRYRVVGIAWGGTASVISLEIRFNPNEAYRTVLDVRPAEGLRGYWRQWWTPASRGSYIIQLRDLANRSKRLDTGYYARVVQISEV